jgi:hypothetical protein
VPGTEYVLGHGRRERERLIRQADTFAAEASWLLEQVGVRSGGRVAEFGCGPPGIMNFLSEGVGNTGQTVGIDNDPRMIATAREVVAELGLRNVSLVLADAAGTGLERSSFDVAHARLLLIHSPHPERVGRIPEQSCDFDASRGLVKTWLFLGGAQPLDDILAADGVPEAIRRHGPLFQSLELTHCRHEMTEYISPGAYTFSVTISPAAGAIERVGFYALKLPAGRFPAIGDRLTRFFSEAPSYDREDMNAVACSLGNGQDTYIKAERSYCGDLVPLLKGWNTFFSGEHRQDPALRRGRR